MSVETIPFLFGEDQARYLIAVPYAEGEELVAAAMAAGVVASIVGRTGGDTLSVDDRGSLAVSTLRKAHEAWLPLYMNGEEIAPAS